ncbi:MAG: polyprenyl synthetase family protein [Candidatus Brocadiales bacterium]
MKISELFKPIKEPLMEVEERVCRDLSSESKEMGELILHVSRFKGKRLRPALLLLSGRCLGKLTLQHIDLATVVELIHIATLIHDDVIDDATMRRHAPSVNSKWDREISILFGDYIFSRAFTTLTALDSHLASTMMSQTVGVMCEGELVQLLRRYDVELSEEEYIDIIERKTASLCASCCRLGSIFAGANRSISEALGNFGLSVGTAFQIVDDCLDIVGSEDRMGKSLHSDSENGKLTLPLIRLVNMLPENRRESTYELIFQNNHTNNRGAVVELLSKHDAVDCALETAREIIEKGKEAISIIPDSEYKSALMGLADYVVSRKE